MVTRVVPSPPRFLPSIFIPHRVHQSHCSSIFHRVLLTHALALSASQFIHKKKSQRIYTSMHSAGLELTKLTHTRLEDNLIRHRGDRHYIMLRSQRSALLSATVGWKHRTLKMLLQRLLIAVESVVTSHFLSFGVPASVVSPVAYVPGTVVRRCQAIIQDGLLSYY